MDIINQYVTFTKIFDEQVKKHGLVEEAVRETIRICRDRNVLKKYLESRDSEVVDIMFTLFSQEEVWDMQMRSKEKEATEKAVEAMKSTAKKLLREGKLKVGEVAEFFSDLSSEEVAEVEGEMLERV